MAQTLLAEYLSPRDLAATRRACHDAPRPNPSRSSQSPRTPPAFWLLVPLNSLPLPKGSFDPGLVLFESEAVTHTWSSLLWIKEFPLCSSLLRDICLCDCAQSGRHIKGHDMSKRPSLLLSAGWTEPRWARILRRWAPGESASGLLCLEPRLPHSTLPPVLSLTSYAPPPISVVFWIEQGFLAKPRELWPCVPQKSPSQAVCLLDTKD